MVQDTGRTGYGQSNKSCLLTQSVYPAGSLEELRVANCSEVTSEGFLELQTVCIYIPCGVLILCCEQLTKLRALHLYKLPILGGLATHIVGGMPQLTDLRLEGISLVKVS